MKSVPALLCLGCVAATYAATNDPQPRGVGPEFAAFYQAADRFTCISNPSVSIPLARVNDDYCDCPDGSDEPGTAACAHLSPLSPRTPADVGVAAAHGAAAVPANTTLALPGFYCANRGHVARYVPFTSVNDGICDYELCCDGSEEWARVGGVKCADRCQEIGKEWRKHDAARQKALGEAMKKRKELGSQAYRMRREVEDRVKTLHTEIEAGEVMVRQLEAEVAEVEAKDKSRVVLGSVDPKVGKIGVLVGLARRRTEELREWLVKVREERDSKQSRLRELEALLTTFKEEYNPNFNDEGVKRAVRAWEDYAARDKGPEPDAAHDTDLDGITKSDKDNGLDWAEYEGAEESDTDVLYEFERYLPPSLRSWVDQKLRDLRVKLVENGILAAPAAGAGGARGESAALTEARGRLTAAKTSLDESSRSLNSHKKELYKDYGPGGVLRALKDECIALDSGEYEYEVCFMQRTTQKAKKGGGHTNMGKFSGLETTLVDDDLPADGKGLGAGERVVMKFDDGQRCWNGPHRRTRVVLACAAENEIWKIMEEEKCVYRMEVGTPAVCESSAPAGAAAAAAAPAAGGKDEL